MASWGFARVLALYVTCTSTAFGTGRIHGEPSSAPLAGLADLELNRAEEASLLQMRHAANQTRETSGPPECWATLAKHQERSAFWASCSALLGFIGSFASARADAASLSRRC